MGRVFRLWGGNLMVTTVEGLVAEMEALLDRAQEEGRNLTPDEEEQYLKLRRLRELLVDLEEGIQNDQGA